jgi:hypothetical protein
MDDYLWHLVLLYEMYEIIESSGTCFTLSATFNPLVCELAQTVSLQLVCIGGTTRLMANVRYVGSDIWD